MMVCDRCGKGGQDWSWRWPDGLCRSCDAERGRIEAQSVQYKFNAAVRALAHADFFVPQVLCSGCGEELFWGEQGAYCVECGREVKP